MRNKLHQQLLSAGYFPAGMELWPTDSNSLSEVIKREIRDSDYYIIIVGERYGTLSPDGIRSYTEMEYDFAKEIGKSILVFFYRDPAENHKQLEYGGQLEAFKQKLSSNHSPGYCEHTDLLSNIVVGLNSAKNRNPQRGWIKAPLR
jgi:hypothetical protein